MFVVALIAVGGVLGRRVKSNDVLLDIAIIPRVTVMMWNLRINEYMNVSNCRVFFLCFRIGPSGFVAKGHIRSRMLTYRQSPPNIHFPFANPRVRKPREECTGTDVRIGVINDTFGVA